MGWHRVATAWGIASCRGIYAGARRADGFVQCVSCHQWLHQRADGKLPAHFYPRDGEYASRRRRRR